MIITNYLFSFFLSYVCAGAAYCNDHDTSDFPESLSRPDDSPAIGITATWYDDASDRYGHGVLGDAIEPSALTVRATSGMNISPVLDPAHVFEDISTRLANIDGEPGLEVITIR